MSKTAPSQGSMGMPPLGRRAWLRRTALTSGALLARAARGAPAELPLATPESTRKLGAPILNPEYGLPSPHEGEVIRRPTDLSPTQYSSWSFTPLQELSGIVTPNGLFFERHHGGVPDIAPDAHRLAVHGLVQQPLLFTMDDLVRFPSVSRFHFLECSGNSSTEWAAPRGKTVQFTHGLLSCCEWTGVPLATVLEEAGLKREAKWMLAEGADAAAMTRSIPV
jgi:sulfane dehydrogenase subunit SoxC